MRVAPAFLVMVLVAGCLDDPAAVKGVADDEPQTLPEVVRASLEALLDKDADYLVDHHYEGFCRTDDGEQVTKKEFRSLLEASFASASWDDTYGAANDPGALWLLDQASIRNVSSFQDDPQWQMYEDICDFLPDDQAVDVPRNPDSKVPDNFTGFYRLMDDRWIRVGE